MRSINNLLSELRQLNIQIWLEENRLRYRADKDTLTPELLDEIRENKKGIIEFLEQARKNDQLKRLLILAADKDKERIPLSFAQERLWFLNQLEGSCSSTYNIADSICLSGYLNIQALQQAFATIGKRHEILRTKFQIQDGSPIQIIDPQISLKIKVIDLQSLEEIRRETFLKNQINIEANTPFNLEQAPLIRCNLWQLSDTENVLSFTAHHIISDGWSTGIFFQELSTLYNAFSQNQNSHLPELSIQYSDFTLWQREFLKADVLERQLDYWQKQLQYAPELLQLPTDHPRPSIQSYQGRTLNFKLSQGLSEQIEKLAYSSGSTLYILLLGAFSSLLHRYTGISDILLGSPIANRHYKEIEPLIGFFVNTLVLRTNFENNPTFIELLSQIKETSLKAAENQDIPFEQIVEKLQPQRSLSHSPLIQVVFVMQNAPMQGLKFSGIEVTPLELESKVSKFDLTLSMTQTNQGLIGSWEYNSDLFERETIERLNSNFGNFLSSIVNNPEQKISEITFLSDAERQQILIDWNDTKVDLIKDKCIHQLFEEQVEKSPDSVAVVFEEKQLTYQELNAKANQLAHYLQKLGIGSEILVGICVERSLEMVIGLLGILKAGGAYVPLDPKYPQERLAYMLEDSQVKVLLTQSSLQEKLPKIEGTSFNLDSDWQKLQTESTFIPTSHVTSDNLAYIIYTSGSTGRPKGVMIEHRGACNLIQTQIKKFNLDSSSHILQFASFSFDASVWEFFSSLLSGARLILRKANNLIPGDDLVNTLNKYSITQVFFTPSTLNVLPIDGLTSLKTIIAGGEACPLSLAQKWAKKYNFFNGYGPTEATIFSTFAQIKSNDSYVSIGRPIPNSQIYILDKYLNPVPIGVAGEIHIGGVGLARGYLNRPELTAEKFISNPFKQEERIYKTGDLARYLPDGNIEYLGRIDNQVKIRGYRIELGEIEAVLESNPLIQQAIVIAREDDLEDRKLVAYLVTHNESINNSQIRSFLKEKLPDFMIPSFFVTLERFPLTLNGKIDYKHLPSPNYRANRQYGVEKPSTTQEGILANIWADILKINKVGVNDNFFDLGGHSLLLTNLFHQIEEAFQVKLPISTIFQAGTVKELAKILSQENGLVSSSSLVSLQPKGTNKPLFLIHPCNGEILIYRLLAKKLGPDFPVYGLQAVGLDGQKKPLYSVEEMADNYIKEIQKVQPHGPYYLGGKHIGSMVALEIAQRLISQGQKVELIVVLGGLERLPYQFIDSYRFSANWISLQIKNFKKFGYGYMWEKIKTIINTFSNQSRHNFNVFLSEILSFNHIRIIPEKQTDVELSINEAYLNYKPQAYYGKMIHFQPLENYENLAFKTIFFNSLVDNASKYQDLEYKNLIALGKIFKAGFEINYVPGTDGGNYSAYKEPHVDLFAQKLRIALFNSYKMPNKEEVFSTATSSNVEF